MIPINLIPTHRIHLRRRRERVHRWLRIGGTYATILIMSGFVFTFLPRHGDGQALSAELQLAERSIDEAGRGVETLRAELADARQALDLARRIGTQPDWSVPLAAIANVTGDEIVLGRCALVRSRAALRGFDTPPEAGERPYVITLAGYARSQTAVNDFVDRLEQSGLLEAVTLSGTRRETFLGGDAVTFDIAAVVGVREGAAP